MDMMGCGQASYRWAWPVYAVNLERYETSL
jgi:hypothetical protein